MSPLPGDYASKPQVAHLNAEISGRDKTVTLWTPDGAKLRSLKPFEELPLRAVFSHDGQRVFTTDFTGRVEVWNAEDGKLAGQLDANPPLLADRIVAATDLVAKLEPLVPKSAERIRGAETSLKNASEALSNTETALTQVQRELKDATKALEELPPASTNASAGETEQRRAASEKQVQAAQPSVTAAIKSKDAATKAVEQAKKVLASARAESVKTSPLAVQAKLLRLRNGQMATEEYHLREALTARKDEQAQLAASLQANRESLNAAERELADCLARAVKAEQDARTLRAEIERQEPLLKSAASEIEAESVRLKRVEEKHAHLRNNSE